MAAHSSTLAWKIPWMKEPGRLQTMGSLYSGTTEQLHFHFSLLCIGEGNDNPLQCSCLENPRDGGAWLAPLYGVIQSRTWLQRLINSSIITVFLNHFFLFSDWMELGTISLKSAQQASNDCCYRHSSGHMDALPPCILITFWVASVVPTRCL